MEKAENRIYFHLSSSLDLLGSYPNTGQFKSVFLKYLGIFSKRPAFSLASVTSTDFPAL